MTPGPREQTGHCYTLKTLTPLHPSEAARAGSPIGLGKETGSEWQESPLGTNAKGPYVSTGGARAAARSDTWLAEVPGLGLGCQRETPPSPGTSCSSKSEARREEPGREPSERQRPELRHGHALSLSSGHAPASAGGRRPRLSLPPCPVLGEPAEMLECESRRSPPYAGVFQIHGMCPAKKTTQPVGLTLQACAGS